MNPKNRNYFFLLFLIGAILTIWLLCFINIQYNLNYSAKLIPSKENIISMGNDGSLFNILADYKKGIRSDITVLSIERGDSWSFSINERIKSGDLVTRGDTIGSVVSSNLTLELETYRGRLEELKALYEETAAGLKKEDVKIFENELEYARRQFGEHTILLKRYSALAEKNLISYEDYEIEKGKNELFKIQIEIAQSRLNSALIGMKPASLASIKTQIQSAGNNLKQLMNKLKRFTITAGIDGIIERVITGDTLAVLSDYSEYVLLIPVRLTDRDLIKMGQRLSFTLPDSIANIEAEIIDISHKVDKINETSVVLVYADGIKGKPGFFSGLIVEVKINCGEVSLFEYVKRMFN